MDLRTLDWDYVDNFKTNRSDEELIKVWKYYMGSNYKIIK
jgi:hypothetical protein